MTIDTRRDVEMCDLTGILTIFKGDEPLETGASLLCCVVHVLAHGMTCANIWHVIKELAELVIL